MLRSGAHAACVRCPLRSSRRSPALLHPLHPHRAARGLRLPGYRSARCGRAARHAPAAAGEFAQIPVLRGLSSEACSSRSGSLHVGCAHAESLRAESSPPGFSRQMRFRHSFDGSGWRRLAQGLDVGVLDASDLDRVRSPAAERPPRGSGRRRRVARSVRSWDCPSAGRIRPAPARSAGLKAAGAPPALACARASAA